MDQRRAGGSKRILIADDDSAVCELLRVVLAPFAHVTMVSDAESALEALASDAPFDAIVSDFKLPGIDGLEFVQRVRRDERDTHIPILMISGSGRVIGESARAAGCDAYLDKPFTLGELRETINTLLFSAPSVRR